MRLNDLTEESFGDYVNALKKGLRKDGIDDVEYKNPIKIKQKAQQGPFDNINTREFKNILFAIINKKDLDNSQLATLEKLYNKL